MIISNLQLGEVWFLREQRPKIAAVKVNDKENEIFKTIFQIQYQEESISAVHEHFQSAH